MTGIADRRAERVVLRTLGIGAELNRTRDTNVENPQSRVGSGLGSRSPCRAGGARFAASPYVGAVQPSGGRAAGGQNVNNMFLCSPPAARGRYHKVTVDEAGTRARHRPRSYLDARG